MLKSMQSLVQSGKIILTKEQIEEIHKFTQDLENNSTDITFEGSLLEGKAYLNGLAEIVEATNHA